MDKPTTTGGDTNSAFGGDMSSAISWLLPLAIGTMGFANPQGARSLTSVAQILAQQQTTANLEKERAINEAFRQRQEAFQGRTEARDVAREQAGIKAGQMFPELMTPISESVPAVPGTPAVAPNLANWPAEDVGKPAGPELPGVTANRGPTQYDLAERIRARVAAGGMDEQTAAALSKIALGSGAPWKAERPIEVQHAEAARALGPLLMGHGIDATTAFNAMRMVQATGQMPSMELLSPEKRLVHTPQMIYSFDRMGNPTPVQALTPERAPIHNVLTTEKGQSSLVIYDPNTKKVDIKPLGQIGPQRAPSALSGNEVFEAAELLARGVPMEQVAATVPEFAKAVEIFKGKPEEFKTYVNGVLAHVKSVSLKSVLGDVMKKTLDEAGLTKGGTVGAVPGITPPVKAEPTPPLPPALKALGYTEWNPETKAWRRPTAPLP